MTHRLLTGSLVLAALAPLALGQGHRTRSAEIDARLEPWREQHGASWRADLRPGSGRVEMIWGGNAVGPLEPASDAEWFAQARHFLAQTAPVHALDGAEFVDDRVRFLPLGQGGTTDKFAVHLRQEVGGVPVEGGGVSMIFATDGRLLGLHTTAVPGLSGQTSVPTLSADQARRRAAADFARVHGEATRSGDPRLEFARFGSGDDARLVWAVELHQEVRDGKPIGLEYAIDAADGSVFEVEQRVHDLDVRGTVMMNATPGIEPDSAGNPPTSVPVPFAWVQSPTHGIAIADQNGDFVYPGVNVAIDVTAEFVGSFNDVNNQGGGAPNETLTQNLPPNQANTLLLNAAPTEETTAQANCYAGVQATRDYVRRVTPSDATADFTIVSNPNLASDCNAFFDGSSINFFTSGGGCVNTAYSTVVAHELGHWLNVLYGTNNNSTGMGEGNADVFAMYTYDDPEVGRGFCGPGCSVRNGMNTRQWRGPGAYGQVHADGEVWMGAAWKVRRNLNVTHGNTQGDLIADTLFMGWMNGFDQQDIGPVIESQWLTLDDDDGNLLTSTPNLLDIDGAFREQGFPGADFLVDISGVTVLGDTTNELGPYTIDATIDAQVFPPVASADVHYRVNGGALQSVPMTQVGGSAYRADLPGIPSPARVEYWVEATDSIGAGETFPADTADALPFRIGIVTVVQETGFESGPEGWTAGDPTDTATTGLWELGDPLGTGAQPEDDHTAGGSEAWFTGQGTPGGGLGENDIDGGTTTLFTSTYDLTGLFSPRLSYWRWYSNDTGANPNSDIFEVDASNDGGQTWTPVEVVGPSGPETSGGWFRSAIDIANFVTPSAAVVLRFRASDADPGSVVEAVIDDVLLDDVASSGCAAATSYCTAAVNSTGVGATIAAGGSQSVSVNAFELTVSGTPANHFGLFMYSQGQGQSTFGDGFDCLGGGTPFFLMPLARSDAQGTVQRSPDLTNPPSAAAMITAGSTWNFQYMYRDRLGPGGSGFNLTDAVAVPFCN